MCRSVCPLAPGGQGPKPAEIPRSQTPLLSILVITSQTRVRISSRLHKPSIMKSTGTPEPHPQRPHPQPLSSLGEGGRKDLTPSPSPREERGAGKTSLFKVPPLGDPFGLRFTWGSGATTAPLQVWVHVGVRSPDPLTDMGANEFRQSIFIVILFEINTRSHSDSSYRRIKSTQKIFLWIKLSPHRRCISIYSFALNLMD